jgi:hypothetical protein
LLHFTHFKQRGARNQEESRWKIHEMQRRSGRRSHGPGLAGSVMPFPDLPSVPLFFRSLDGPRLIASRAPAHLALTGCATAQAKPCLPPLGGPWWYKSYFPPFLFLMQRISDWRTHSRGNGLGRSRLSGTRKGKPRGSERIKADRTAKQPR